MPVIALNHPVELPVGAMRTHLRNALPEWSWRCGDDDMGGPRDSASLGRPHTILGRGADGIVMMSIAQHERPLPLDAAAPPHRVHLTLTQPTTDNPELAKRIAVIACAALTIDQDLAAQAQIAPGGRWYSVDELREALEHCTANNKLLGSVDEVLGRCGKAGASIGAAPVTPLTTPRVRSAAEMMNVHADLERTFATILARQGGAKLAAAMGFAPPPPYSDERPRTDRLPTLVLGLGGSISPDWAILQEGCTVLDPDGGWSVQPDANGGAVLAGRGTAVTLAFEGDPIPRYCIESALSRSFWFKDGWGAFAAMRAQLIVTADIDTRSAQYEDVRHVASVISLAVGLLAGESKAIALLNAGIDTLLPAQDVHRLTACLANGELPLMVWTWTAPHSMADGDVSLSTGGMLPFLGYEVEIWNAPGTATLVGEKLSGILKYLLHHGPIVTDGNSFGETPGDRSIRGFFGDSRAGRGDPTKALFLEFDAVGDVQPKPDPLPLPRSAPPSRPSAAPARPRTGFGRKGL